MLLGAGDPLPCHPRRVLVAGTSGAGKTTLAARLSQALGLRHVEIDALFHGPYWTPRATFVAEVEAFSAQPGWVTEWQYRQVRPLLAERADLLVWLDLSRAKVMRQVVARTIRRQWRRGVVERQPGATALDHLHGPRAHRALGLDHTREECPTYRDTWSRATRFEHRAPAELA